MAIAEYACMVCNAAHITKRCEICWLRLCNQCTCNSTIEASTHHNVALIRAAIQELVELARKASE